MSDQAIFNDNLNENEIMNDEENNNQDLEDLDMLLMNEQQNNEPLISKLSSRDFIDIINDIFPSLLFIVFLIFPFYYSPSYCDLNIYLSMKTLVVIYLCFIIRALIKLSIIHYNKKSIIKYKIFLSFFDLLTSLSYYICIYCSYLIYSQSDAKCFKLDTFTIFCFFSIIFIGIISFFQTCINFIMLSIYFFFLLESFISNPVYFYNNYGMDPEMIKNLPTVKADNRHLGSCAICLKNINDGDPILILSCPGKHYFHGECIKSWLLVKTCCPMCRSELVL